MKEFLQTLLLSCALLISSLVRADVLVLVHGWASSADTWLANGVMPALAAHGWHDAGVVSALPGGVQYIPIAGERAAHKVYRVHLPAEAPLLIQAAHLFTDLQFIKQRHPDESITLAGHSAGGLVARLVAVRNDSPAIKQLITIASPNLGTGRAIQGLDVAESKPFFCPGPGVHILKSFIGGDDYDYLRDSRGALIDMVPQAPGSLLGWLNQQPHPDIEYHAIIRKEPYSDGDWIAPAFAQDLNQVPALRGRAKVHITPASHFLNPADGVLLASILNAS
jgi:pimeloyl-ACP methyl ester carboxylesterase